MTWIVSILLLVALWIVVAKINGPQSAVAVVALVSCAVPTWCRLDVTSTLPIEARIVATLFALGAYCLHPKSTFPWRLGLLDFSMLGLISVHVLSDAVNSGVSGWILLRMYGEWCVPYLAGRLAFHNLETLRVAAPIASGIALVLAIGGILQATTTINLWELIYGERFLDGVSRTAHRWGMLRAWGCCGHPIYFGLLQVAFLPWLLRDWYAGLGTKNQRWLWILPTIGICGIVSSAARGPVLSALFTIMMSVYLLKAKSRPILLAGALICVILTFILRDQAFDGLHRWGGESVDSQANPTVLIGDETVQLTGTAYRIHLFNAFRNAVIRAGWLGFGTESVTGFPIHIPLDAAELVAIQKVKFVDNEYLLLALRFGWLGATFFTLALAIAARRWIERRKSTGWINSSWCVFVGSSIAATALCLLTVWMPQDVGFPLLLMMGACSASFRSNHTSY